MNRSNAIAAIRTRAERCMRDFSSRIEAAAAFQATGFFAAAYGDRRIAEIHLQRVAELLSIENHLNGVSPE